MKTLCETCHRVIFSWETAALFDGTPSETRWTHWVPSQSGPLESHPAVPMRFFINHPPLTQHDNA